MSIAYAQKNKNAVQTKRESSVSIIDTSSQSESLQRKADMANNAAQRAEAPRPNNTGMPDNLKSGIESLSGFSMDDVRVHYNSSKPATVQALAYTQGTDIHVAPGQEKHLPHEAWHVAQQMAGRVSPTTNINGMPVNDNAALEHEADVMGERAVQLKANESKTQQKKIFRKNVLQMETWTQKGRNILEDIGKKYVLEFTGSSLTVDYKGIGWLLVYNINDEYGNQLEINDEYGRKILYQLHVHVNNMPPHALDIKGNNNKYLIFTELRKKNTNPALDKIYEEISNKISFARTKIWEANPNDIKEVLKKIITKINYSQNWDNYRTPEARKKCFYTLEEVDNAFDQFDKLVVFLQKKMVNLSSEAELIREISRNRTDLIQSIKLNIELADDPKV